MRFLSELWFLVLFALTVVLALPFVAIGFVAAAIVTGYRFGFNLTYRTSDR